MLFIGTAAIRVLWQGAVCQRHYFKYYYVSFSWCWVEDYIFNIGSIIISGSTQRSTSGSLVRFAAINDVCLLRAVPNERTRQMSGVVTTKENIRESWHLSGIRTWNHFNIFLEKWCQHSWQKSDLLFSKRDVSELQDVRNSRVLSGFVRNDPS